MHKKIICLFIVFVMMASLQILKVKAIEKVGVVQDDITWIQDLIEQELVEGGRLYKEGSSLFFDPIVEKDDVYVNRYRMKFLIATHVEDVSQDIVLVIDQSGSMNYDDKMLQAKNAAKQFVDEVLKNTTNKQIGIVGFSSNAVVHSELSNNQEELKAVIDSLDVGGGTLTQGGIYKAKDLLEGSKADEKIIVLLSDGEPTFMYDVSNPLDYLIDDEQHHKVVRHGLPEDEYIRDSNFIVGTGRSTWYKPWFKNYYLNCAYGAYDEATYAKDRGITMYSIGLMTNTNGSAFLKEIATSSDDFFEVRNANDLIPVFNRIVRKLKMNVKNVSVDLNLNQGFEYPINEDLVSHTSTSKNSNIEVIEGKLNWNMDGVITPYKDNIYYEYAIIECVINDDILDQDISHGINVLQEGIKYSYYDGKNHHKEIQMGNTNLYPDLYIVLKDIINSELALDSNKHTFQFHVDKEYEGNTINEEAFVLKDKQEYLLKDLKWNESYVLYELEDAYTTNDESLVTKEFKVNDYFNVIQASKDNPIAFKTPSNKDIHKGNTFKLIAKNAYKENIAKVTIQKVIEGIKEESTISNIFQFELIPVQIGETPIPTSIKPIRFEIDGEGEITLSNDVYFYKYQLHEIEDHLAPFVPSKNDQGKIIDLTLMDVIKDPNKGKVISFTNILDEDLNKTAIKVCKEWVNGSTSDHDQLELELYRVIEGNEVEEVVTGVTPVIHKVSDYVYEYVFNDLPIIDTNTNKRIRYTRIKEVNEEDGLIYYGDRMYDVMYSGNAEEGFKIINTYKQDLITLTVIKDWDGAYMIHPRITFTLYRKVNDGLYDEVIDSSKILESNMHQIAWNVEESDLNGNVYQYAVKETFTDETDVNNDNWILNNDYEVFDEDHQALFINTFISNDSCLKIHKQIVYDENINLANESPLEFVFELIDPNNQVQSFTLKANETKEFKGLPYGTYTIKEVDSKGFIPSFSINDGVVTISKENKDILLEVTNKNGSDDDTLRSITIHKQWVNGPKGEAVIELWRIGLDQEGNQIDERVDVEAFVVSDIVSAKTYDKLPRYDLTGNEYKYYAKEVSSPMNYETSYTEDGLGVINTYIPPSITYKVQKVWDGNGVTIPSITLSLYRKVEGNEYQIVKGQDKQIDANTTIAEWNVEETDLNGKEYQYAVKESFSDQTCIYNDNWTLIDDYIELNTLETVITNTLIEPTGSIRIKKELEQDTRSTLDFVFVVTSPQGFYRQISLKANEEVIIGGLYYGTYKVEEVESHGFIAEYSNGDGIVTITKQAPMQELIVVNKNSEQTTIDITITKQWVNGPKNGAMIELHRIGYDVNGILIEEVIGEPFEPTEQVLTKTYKDLNRFDAIGSPYKYFAKEVVIPKDYKVTYSDDQLTVINIYIEPVIPDPTNDHTNNNDSRMNQTSSMNIPKTGDQSKVVFMVNMLAISIGVIYFTVIQLKK